MQASSSLSRGINSCRALELEAKKANYYYYYYYCWHFFSTLSNRSPVLGTNYLKFE